MRLKFGTGIPYGVSIRQKEAPSTGKILDPVLDIFIPTLCKSVIDFFDDIIYIGHIIYKSIAIEKLTE